ncbi:MAG: hypothetical protein GXP02_01305 [Alphaproteobacteria bacterium]|nr:hypothetical protein [Alphaproteobacteria bacterium]
MLHGAHIYLKRVLLLAFILVPVGNLHAGAGQTVLLSDLDIPLMQGFDEEQDSRVMFDTPEGRIVEARASGPQEPVRVFNYYRRVLPSLSWHNISGQPATVKNCNGPATFCISARRDGEILTIKISRIKKSGEKSAARTIIYFSVSPE